MARPGVESGEGMDAAGRSVVYCVIPLELAPKLHDLLRDHFGDEPEIEVIVERRGRERRAGGERRGSPAPSQWGDPPVGAEQRRQIRSPGGRRVGERRATLAPLEPGAAPELPRRARRYADRIGFVECPEPSTQALEDQDSARLVTRFQAGDGDAFTTLYTRYYNRLYTYLRTVLRDPDEAEDATQQVFTQVLEALPRYERRRQPFRAWLFVLGRNLAVSTLRKQGKLTLEEPEEIERRRELSGEQEEEVSASLTWLSDRDLMLFAARLPLPQRQVLLLRYGLDFSNKEIAEILDRDAADVARLHHRATSYLRERLVAIGRAPSRGERAESMRPLTQIAVLRARRFALTWRS